MVEAGARSNTPPPRSVDDGREGIEGRAGNRLERGDGEEDDVPKKEAQARNWWTMGTTMEASGDVLV